WGKKNTEAIRKIFGFSIKFSIIAAIILFTLVQLFPHQILRFYTNSSEAIEHGVKYIRIVSVSYLFFSFTSTYTIAMRSVEKVKISLFVNIISFFVNVFFNWVFIYGNLGAPRLEAAGAAIGTVIARFCELIIILIYIFFFEKTVKFKFKDIFKRDKLLFKDYIKFSSPVAGNELMWGLGTSVLVAILGQISISVTAANNIATVISQLITVFLFGVANATVVIVGKQIGSGKIPYAKQCAKTLQVISLIVGFVLMAILLLVKDFALSMYNLSQESMLYSNWFIIVLALIIPFQSFTATAIIGTLRGGGDTKFGFICDLTMLWFYAIPLALLMVFVFTGIPVWLIYFVIKSEEIVKTIMVFFRMKSGKWLNVVARDDLN
ncbi:MAG: MATE family efflux transporter, partial [Oscillospiraceae bacterium]